MRARLQFDTRRILGRAEILGHGLREELLQRFPVDYLRRNRVLPLRFDEAEARLELVINEPDRVQLIEEVLEMAGARCALVKRAAPGAIEQILDGYQLFAGRAAETETPPAKAEPADEPAVAVHPTAEPALPEAADRAPAVRSARPTGRQRVLVVESDPALRNAVGTLFEGDGHRVFVAEGLSALGGSLRSQVFDLAVVRAEQVDDPGALSALLRQRNANAEVNVTASYSQLLRGEPVPYDIGSRFWFGFVDLALGMLDDALPAAPRCDRRLLSCTTLLAQSLGLARKTVDTIRLAMVLEHLGEVQMHVASRAGAALPGSDRGAPLVEALLRELRCPYEVLPLVEAAGAAERGGVAHSPPIEVQVLLVAKRCAAHRRSGGTPADFEASLRADAGTLYDARVAETLLSVLKGDRLLAQLDRGKRVVIADSSADDAATLALRLRNEGFEVEVCRDGQSALETIRREPPHLVVSEVALPKLDGFGVLTTLRSDPRLAAVPFFFVSARAEASVVARGLRLGADDHLAKPVDPEVVLIKATRFFAAANAAPEGSISGDLAEVSLVDLLQLVSEAAKTVRIEIRAAARAGDVFLQDGTLVHARCGKQSGADAFLSLVRLTEGRFTVHAGQAAPERSIAQPLELLILEGMRVAG